MRKEDVSNFQKAGQYLIWHFHLISTPIVPYAHKCCLDKNFASCWNCRGYLQELWPYGRVESRSPEHGFKEHNKAYRFFKNLYDYEERETVLIGRGKFDKETNQRLNGNQHLFRRADNTYFYRTNEQNIGSVAQPLHLKKNFRLSTPLNPVNLAKLARKNQKKESLNLSFGRKKKKIFTYDFQEFLITNLLALCQKAEFSKVPLEAEQVPKEGGQCDKALASHFQTKSVLNFTFTPENAELAQQFFNQLDDYAEEYEAPRGGNLFFSPPKKEKARSKNMKNTPEKPDLKNFSDTELQAELLKRKRERRILEYRDVIYSRIIEEIRKYYRRVQSGDYRYDGMPEISRAATPTIIEMNPSKEIMPEEKRLICSHCGREIKPDSEDFCEKCDGDFHSHCLKKAYDRGVREKSPPLKPNPDEPNPPEENFSPSVVAEPAKRQTPPRNAQGRFIKKVVAGLDPKHPAKTTKKIC
ncbi:10831_t:CDS:2 [Cetraspora pellucida]|uniref:10831_t:CDS:1 n=1 Tax=Cetraspora pellucida TaxID=1433469 RepID=A0A9N9D9D5_9GLOM|nr:10831_t:CDS:2 [Cetraspora pellucida]